MAQQIMTMQRINQNWKMIFSLNQNENEIQFFIHEDHTTSEKSWFVHSLSLVCCQLFLQTMIKFQLKLIIIELKYQRNGDLNWHMEIDMCYFIFDLVGYVYWNGFHFFVVRPFCRPFRYECLGFIWAMFFPLSHLHDGLLNFNFISIFVCTFFCFIEIWKIRATIHCLNSQKANREHIHIECGWEYRNPIKLKLTSN